MLNVEEAVYDTYMRNMEFIRGHDKELFKSLEVFDRALASGDIEAAYELEYRDNYFELIDLKTQRPLYGSNSLDVSKKLVKDVTKSKDSYAFEVVPLTNYAKELVENAGKLSAVAKLSDYCRDIGTQSGTLEEIEKFIVVGVGLGLHIPYIHNAIFPRSYFIIEDNLEIFRLSLFTTKYYELAQAAEIKFAVANDEDMFAKNFAHYLDNNYMYNRFIKYFHFPYHNENKIVQIKNTIVSQGFLVYAYQATLAKVLRPLEYLNNGYKSLNIFSEGLNKSYLSSKPLLVLAAGPSFAKNIEWIKENQERFVIIAVSAVLPTLYEHNIRPDIVTHIDVSDITLKFYDGIDEEFLSHTLFAFTSQVSTKLRNRFPKERIYYLEDGNSYIQGIGVLTTPCVGSTSVALALALHSKEIFLLGLDLAFDQETGSTHYKGHKYAKEIDVERMREENKYKITLDEEILEVEGNFRETVTTNTRLWYSSYSLNKVLPKLYYEGLSIKNLSDGVKLEKTQAVKIEEIILENYPKMDKLSEFLFYKSALDENSISQLSPNDVKQIREKLAFAKKVQKVIEAYAQVETPKEYKRYLYELLGVMIEIMPEYIRKENATITSVYDDFAKFVLPIIFDTFNTVEVENKNEHIPFFDKVVKENLADICEMYIEKVEHFLNERVD